MVSQISTSGPSYWCWGKDLPSLIGVRENEFGAEGKMIFDVEKKRRKRAEEMGYPTCSKVP